MRRPGSSDGWPWWWALVALVIIYIYAHYAFASLVAHVTAMFPAFFAAVVGFGAPPLAGRRGVRGLFESERRDDPLWNGAGADRVRVRLSDAGTVVAHRIRHVAGAPGDLAADWLSSGGRRSACGDGAEQSMTTYRVAVIPGDGIGTEVTPAAIRTLEAAAERFGFRFEWEHFPWGSEHYLRARADDAGGRARSPAPVRRRSSSARSAIPACRTTSR